MSLTSLLSALGLTSQHPVPKLLRFINTNPLGCANTSEIPKHIEDDECSSSFSMLLNQVKKLRSTGECIVAINRVLTAVQTLTARYIVLFIIATVSTFPSVKCIPLLEMLDLGDVEILVRLLRLVYAGRINGIPGSLFFLNVPDSSPLKGLDCVGEVLRMVVTWKSSAGSQLLQACSRDLVGAALGGAQLATKKNERKEQRSDRSDLSVLVNPNFYVSQKLVQIMAEVAGKSDGSSMIHMIDALAACLFSSKLEPDHRFWALKQLMTIFSTTKPVLLRSESKSVICIINVSLCVCVL